MARVVSSGVYQSSHFVDVCDVNATRLLLHCQSNMDHNTRVAKAIADLKTQDRTNIAATARKYDLTRETLSKRWRGITGSQEDYYLSLQQLTETQETELVEYVNKLTNRGFPPTPQLLKNIAESLSQKTLGPNWVARFYQRHRTRLASIYLRTIDHKRKMADNSQHFQHFFDLLREKIEKFRIQPRHIYNMDEKGFIQGISRTTKRVVAIESLRRKRIAGASQDGNREFITLIAGICADGSSIPPALIYQGSSFDLQDTWLDDFNHSQDRAYFASSKHGWSDDTLGLEWLKLFDRETRKKITPRDYRLIILDGHNSHVNMPFIEYAHANRILLAVFPPHSTHRLQPLDVGLFSPLANYYSQAINRLLHESQGFCSLTKRDFWSMFSEAWERAFHAINVRSAFEATGLHPLQPEKVIIEAQKRETTPEEELLEEKPCKTPGSSRGLRRLYQRLEKEGKVHPDAKKLLHAGEKLATKADIAQHEVNGLRKAIVHEKKKRKRGKAMHLWEEDENQNQGRFFSPAKIGRLRERMVVAQEAQAQRQRSMADKKLQVAIEREEKALEKAKKKEERELKRKNAREQLVREKAERATKKEAQKVAKAAENARRKREAGEKRMKRLEIQKLKATAKQSKKRSLEDQAVNSSSKRVRLDPSRRRSAANSHVSPSKVDRIVAESSATTTIAWNTLPNIMQNARESRRLNVQSGRFGRTVKLPTRFA